MSPADARLPPHFQTTFVYNVPSADRALFHAFFAGTPDANTAAASQGLQLGALGFGGSRVTDASPAAPGAWVEPRS